MSTMQALAASILESATALSQELSAAGVDDYSLDSEQAPVDLPLLSVRGSNAQSSLIVAAEQILRLARGPLGYLNNYGLTVVEAGTLRALVKLGIPTRIPLGESRSYQELADDVNISPELLQRLIRYAAVCGFLREDDDGKVRHNSASVIFVRDHEASGGVSWNLEVPLKAAPQMFEALQRDPLGQDPRACAASLAYQSGAALPTLWEIHDMFPILRDQFHDLMVSSCSSPLESIEHLVGGVDWTVLNTVIDVGGSRGHASQAITARYPHIRCIVQDTKEGIAQGVEAENVAFMEHDFFKPQTVLADAYLYRYIIHDWADGDARRILSGVVPVLRQGTKLIVMDIVAPAPKTVDLHIERCIRGWDVSMGVLLAGKERTLEQFQALVADVEARLRFQTCVRPSGSLMSIMTWVYEG